MPIVRAGWCRDRRRFWSARARGLRRVRARQGGDPRGGGPADRGSRRHRADVWTPPSALPFGVPDDGGPVFDSGLEAEARDVAREGAHLAESVGLHAEPVTSAGGSVWRAIVKEADRRKA